MRNQLMLTAACVLAILLSACQSFPQSAAAIATQQQKTPELPTQRWTTPQGSNVLFVPNTTLPMVDIQLVFAAGSSRDGDVPGLASLTSALIGEDAQGGLTSDDIAKGFESKGARLSGNSYRDMATIGVRSLTDVSYLDPVITLFTQVLAPAFQQADMDRVRTQMMQGLKMDEQVPDPAASKTFLKTVFGKHPYAHPADGTLTSLPTLTRTQLVDFYRRYYTAGNVVIALVGNVSSAQAHDLAERISAVLPQGPHAPALPMAQVQTQPQLVHVPFASSQTHILIGNQAIYRGVPEWPALYVGNWILGGGGFASRLMAQVREKHGYVYGISSDLSPMAAGGPFIISLQTANDSAQQALALTLKVTNQFLKDGPTQQEVSAAIDNITGSFPLSIASNSSIVAQLGAIGFYDLPTDYLTQFIDHIRQVTPAEVKAAMTKYINPANFTIVDVGPKALAWPPAHEAPSGDATK